MDENMKKHEFEEMFRQVMKEHYPELHKPENKRWRAENGNTYWTLHNEGSLEFIKERNDTIDDKTHKLGNYFKTKEEAELYRKKLVITQKVKDIAIRLGEPTEDDWKDPDVEKFYFAFDCQFGDFALHLTRQYKTFGNIYCLDTDFLEVCLEEIGEEDLKLIFT